MNKDDYAIREVERNRAYRDAYESPEAKKWLESLTPEARLHAQELGLLEPRLDWAVNGHSIDQLVGENEPREEGDFNQGPLSVVERRRMKRSGSDSSTARNRKLLRAFLQRNGNPRLTWSAIRYLQGNGSLESHARAIGMSKQDFHYHVRQLERLFGLPPMSNQRSEKSRNTNRLAQLGRVLNLNFDLTPTEYEH